MRLRVGHQQSQFWPIQARYVDCYSLFWGPGVISTIDEPRGAVTCRSTTVAVLADSGPFRGQNSLFWGPGVISTIDETRVRLRVGHQQSQFWPILARFVDYYSLFRGPGVISMIDEPRGALTCRSSTLTILANSGPFHALLLIVLATQSDFHD